MSKEISVNVSYSDMEKMAVVLSRSSFFGVTDPSQMLSLMLISQAEGLHPAIAARDYHIIKGRPSLKSDAMLARYQESGGKVKWIEYTDSVVSGEFTHPSGGTLLISWSIEQAKHAGLTGNQTWQKYPRAMLRARCVSEGIRATAPGCIVGVYTPEEVEDMQYESKKESRIDQVKKSNAVSQRVVEPVIEEANYSCVVVDEAPPSDMAIHLSDMISEASTKEDLSEIAKMISSPDTSISEGEKAFLRVIYKEKIRQV